MELVKSAGELLGVLLGRSPEEALRYLSGYAELFLIFLCAWLAVWLIMRIIESVASMGKGLLIMVCYVIGVILSVEVALSLSRRSPHMPEIPAQNSQSLLIGAAERFHSLVNWTMPWTS